MSVKNSVWIMKMFPLAKNREDAGAQLLSPSHAITSEAADPALRMYDENGSFIAYREDFSYPNDLFEELYELTVAEAEPLPEFTNDQISDYLTDGFWGDVAQDRRAFALDVTRTLTVNLGELENFGSLTGALLARAALQAWSDVTGITFVEVSGAANITFQDTGRGAYSTSVTLGNTILSSTVHVSTGWLTTEGTTIDSYSFQAYLHEIGHALGLGHAGDYNGNAYYGADNHYLNDNWQATVMSYFSQTENSTIDASLAFILTPMIADILAIQDLYGANTGARPGATTYGFNSTVDDYLNDWVDFDTPAAITIYDNSGIDTLDFSGSNWRQVINLTAESYSDVNGLTGNLAIARGVDIENAIGGSTDDMLNGNDLDNLLVGNDGFDTLNGGAGADTLDSGSGLDVLSGGVGADTFVLSGVGAAEILDFEVGVDVLDLRGTGLSNVEIAQAFADADGTTNVSIGLGHTSVTLQGVSVDQLSQIDILPQTVNSLNVVDRAGNALTGLALEFTPEDGRDAVAFNEVGDGTYEVFTADGAGSIAGGREHDTSAGDNSISVLDALEVLRMAVGLDPSWGEADTFDFIAADIDGDGQVTVLDALQVLRYAVNLEVTYEPEWILVNPDLFDAPAGRTNVPTDPGLDFDVDGVTNMDVVAILVGSLTDFA